ncbi:MAG: hypothetical protein ACLUDF_06585 [Butyricicoccus sp.]
MKILVIESSCDETAAAVIEDGRKILSSGGHADRHARAVRRRWRRKSRLGGTWRRSRATEQALKDEMDKHDVDAVAAPAPDDRCCSWREPRRRCLCDESCSFRCTHSITHCGYLSGVSELKPPF